MIQRLLLWDEYWVSHEHFYIGDVKLLSMVAVREMI